MAIEDINAFKFNRETNSWLFLWATQKFLRDAFSVMEAWAFKYFLTMVWDKRGGICLAGFHWKIEFCLVGYTGKIEVFKKGKTIPTLLSVKSTKHSAKPDEFYEGIQHLGTKRIDIFARKSRPGWDAWGNEV